MILSIGAGTTYDGGDMYMKSGDSTANTKDGGAISLVGGYATSNTKAVGGEIVIKTGRGESYTGGAMSLITGEGTFTSSGILDFVLYPIRFRLGQIHFIKDG